MGCGCVAIIVNMPAGVMGFGREICGGKKVLPTFLEMRGTPYSVPSTE